MKRKEAHRQQRPRDQKQIVEPEVGSQQIEFLGRCDRQCEQPVSDARSGIGAVAEDQHDRQAERDQEDDTLYVGIDQQDERSPGEPVDQADAADGEFPASQPGRFEAPRCRLRLAFRAAPTAALPGEACRDPDHRGHAHGHGPGDQREIGRAPIKKGAEKHGPHDGHRTHDATIPRDDVEQLETHPQIPECAGGAA